MRIIEHKKTVKLPDGTEQDVIENEFVYSLRCGFCNTETGTLSFMNTERTDVETHPERYGIADSRCDACLKMKGTYAAELEVKAAAELKQPALEEIEEENS